MKNTICVMGGRVHIEPAAGGDAVLLSIQSDRGEVASVLVNDPAGGAIMFAIEHSLEMAALQRARPVAGPMAAAECWACGRRRDEHAEGICPMPDAPGQRFEVGPMVSAPERAAVRDIFAEPCARIMSDGKPCGLQTAGETVGKRAGCPDCGLAIHDVPAGA